MIALAIHPAQRELLLLLCARLEVGALLNPTRRPLPGAPVPVFAGMGELLDHGAPRACVFLWPYPGLKEDALACLERGIPTLSAGPVPGIALRWGGQHRFSPLFQAALAQRHSPEFGEPVYLRRLVAGGDLQASWWAACQALAEARDLVDAPLAEIQVAACKEGRKHHLALSVSFANGAFAHLLAAPVHCSPSLDLTLLGSGGLAFSDSAANLPALVRKEGARLQPPAFLFPEPAWVQDFLDHLDQPAPDCSFQMQLLGAGRRAARLRKLVRALP